MSRHRWKILGAALIAGAASAAAEPRTLNQFVGSRIDYDDATRAVTLVFEADGAAFSFGCTAGDPDAVRFTIQPPPGWKPSHNAERLTVWADDRPPVDVLFLNRGETLSAEYDTAADPGDLGDPAELIRRSARAVHQRFGAASGRLNISTPAWVRSFDVSQRRAALTRMRALCRDALVIPPPG